MIRCLLFSHCQACQCCLPFALNVIRSICRFTTDRTSPLMASSTRILSSSVPLPPDSRLLAASATLPFHLVVAQSGCCKFGGAGFYVGACWVWPSLSFRSPTVSRLLGFSSTDPPQSLPPLSQGSLACSGWYFHCYMTHSPPQACVAAHTEGLKRPVRQVSLAIHSVQLLPPRLLLANPKPVKLESEFEGIEGLLLCLARLSSKV
mmetsp:Transcript_43216/g.108194  ORF Transcript_43216/g.108194 Transcript_43216/m.108194 type:complete len:205 (-) Transcript_43216:881-1495(-)